MKSTWTLNENSTGLLTVEVEEKAWKKAQDKTLENAIKNVEIQGFRKGQAPKELARKQVNEQMIMMDAVNAIANEAFVAGMVEQKIEPVATPELDIEAMTEDALTLKFIVTVKPEVELGEYKGLDIKRKRITVSAKDIEAELVKLQEEQAELQLKEGAVENGDTVVMDFEGFKDGVAFEGGKGENYTLEIGSNSFIPGFEEAMIGMVSEDEKDLDITFPEEYHVEDLAGQPVVFKVKLHEVKTKVLPELNDEFVELLDDEEITSLDALKDSIKKNLKAQREQAEEDRVNEELVETISNNAKINIPAAMIEEELNQMFNEFNQRLAQQGMNFDLYSQILGQSEEDVKEQMREDAEKRVRTRLTLEKIAEVEGLKVEDEEIEKEFTTISEAYGMELDQVKNLVSPDAIGYDILLRKAMELVQETLA
ncbi:trigger factor [Erysipelothrix rhusiopathiae]|uniref:Trigger factor n=2 Tax=Erysipelothrix rhusiopathiae TaxID=1648 RepID=E7FWA4_ERYRH|nr:trigger factor [Erysipelothrix rhusiopathiae]AYV34403.1 trigger factor [Erysipelothrix rhusiopathiae]EFY09174.1 trigger factor [Erysipelothrix rhusiopathiae ATCC 19414]MCG4456224.1 trigger factor [Erysipelothrix rhusiopathiae]MDE8032446.1 trigger factor [Erysipelothrix rhusiopathiae]MDE8036279.1 trigger factor [Erysipelothrix rhusiopathiae]